MLMTDERLPSDLVLTREGNTLIIKTRTATVSINAERWRELVAAIKDICE